MFINKCFTSIFFSWVKGIDFSNLWDKGVLQFNGMVKGSVRRKNIVGLFREDVCEVLAELQDRDFFGFVSLGKLSGDHDLIDLFP